MNAITSIIYDLDGTLIDSAADIAVALNRVRDHYALPPLEEWEVRSFVGDGARKLLELFRGFYSEDPVIETKLAPGAEKALRHWRDQGAALVVLTNKPQAIAEEVVRQLGVHHYFDLVVGGGALDDDGNPLPLKPDPILVDHVLDQTGAPRDETVMVGDGLPDVELAKAAGIRCMVMLNGYTDPDVLLGAAADLEWVATSFQAADDFLRAQA